MRQVALVGLLAWAGCAGGTVSEDADSESALALPNVVPLTIDPSSPGQDIPAISVTICVPGTQKCQTIPHIEVDTASTGLRIYAAALDLDLPEVTDDKGNTIGDCAWNYWGYIHHADVKLGGLTAKKVGIEVIETSDPNAPSSCGADGEYDPNHHNGIIGISPALIDTMQNYYSCNGGGCQSGKVDTSLQVGHPVAMFPTDNNGCVVQLPSVPADGAKAITGKLIFGVGTRSNNQPPADLLTIKLDDPWGQFKVVAQGQVYESAFDSGTWAYDLPFFHNDLCASGSVYLCPATPIDLQVAVLGPTATTSVSYFTSMEIVDYNNLPSGNMAFNNLGTAWPTSTRVTFGIPFFLGRSVYYAYDKKTTTSLLPKGAWVGIEPTVGANQRYRIENVATSKSIDVASLNPTGNYSGQQWKIQSLPGGYARLTNSYTGDGQALDTKNDGYYEPAMAPVGNTSGQFWRFTPVGGGRYRLTNEFRGTGDSLEVESDGTMHMAPNTTSTAQYWTVTPFAP